MGQQKKSKVWAKQFFIIVSKIENIFQTQASDEDALNILKKTISSAFLLPEAQS
jgi:hypothetical protein